MDISLRSILDRLERELSNKIETLRKEIAPLERELADVRRAKSALAKGNEAYLGAPPRRMGALIIESTPPSPYRQLTMKQLAVKALKEHFPNGATATELLEFFDVAWGRNDIIRSSFSPQLSRLKSEGKIMRRGKIWFLLAPDKNEAPTECQSEGAPGDGGDTPSSIESQEIKDLLG